MGFRGADLLTACFGQAVAVFGEYERVEKADGSEVEVEELLTMAREAAFNAIISDIGADDVTRFYIGWLNLFGFSDAEHDVVRRITQIGLNINVDDLNSQTILVRTNTQQSLATAKDRINHHSKLGLQQQSPVIDKVHRAMVLYNDKNKRKELLEYIHEVGNSEFAPFWKVLDSLAEVLPGGSDDHKTVVNLLTNKENLMVESKQMEEQSQNNKIF